MATSGTVGKSLYKIYIVTNVANGKQYIGITNNLSKRWNTHKNANGRNPALHAAIKKYGVSNFVFTHYADAFCSESAKSIEIMLIKEHNTISPNGYNLTSGGDGTFMPSKELINKMSESHKGKFPSDITKKKRSEALKKAWSEGRHKGNTEKSWTLSVEQKKHLSNQKIGDKNPMFGKKQSPEMIAKRVAAHAIAIAKRKAETV